MTDTIYVIDPDYSVREALIALLNTLNIQTYSYCCPEFFLKDYCIRSERNECLIIDADIGRIGSLELIQLLKESNINIPVIVLASTLNKNISDRSLKAGAIKVIYKPITNDILIQYLGQLFNQSYKIF